MNPSDPDKNGSHSCIIGSICGINMPILRMDDEKWIVNVYFFYKEGSVVHTNKFLKGELELRDIDGFDVLVFSLFRSHYNMNSPKILFMNYFHMSVTYAKMVKVHFNDRAMISQDYYPATGRNYLFRFTLAYIIVVCKMLGVPVDATSIRIWQGIPFIWDTTIIGHRRSKTFDDNILGKVFGVDAGVWSLIFQGKYPKEYVYHRVKEHDLDIYADDESDKNSKLDPTSMMAEIVELIRSVPLPLPTIRKYVYLRENEMPSHRNVGQKFKTNKNPLDIIETITINHGIILGAQPYDIFRTVPLDF
tara:strand:- start:190 stop:1101 length:912 start_codon:yes stop_codon:yes gene_type:complete